MQVITIRPLLVCLALAAAALPAAGLAQSTDEPQTGAGRLRPLDANVAISRYVRATLGGPVNESTTPPETTFPEGGIAGGTCSRTATHTDAPFFGQVYPYHPQGGVSQSEIVATSYTLPAAEFPVTIRNIDIVFGTQGADDQVVTHVTFMVWDGTPDTGIIVAQFSTDDDILPHIRCGPGDDAVAYSLVVDPTDAEQIQVFDTLETHTFSVGIRIDAHGLPSPDPCTIDNNACCNAFPATDNGPLNKPNENWIRAVDCGDFGCPPGGGWVNFTNLCVIPPILCCRPSGDWVLRAGYETGECTVVTGACCLANGSCNLLTSTACGQQANSQYRGDGSTCASANCPQPPGACCFQATGGCIDALTQANCGAAGGVFRGGGSVCTGLVCFPVGACCKIDGSCQDSMTPESCTAQSGTFQGNATSCAIVDCPLPVGSCCFQTGFCLDLTSLQCAQGAGNWGGFATSCGVPTIVEPPAATSVCVGGSTTLSVVACGSSPISFQWQKNGSDIPGATGNSLPISNAALGDAGSYSVILGGPGGTRTTPAALLRVTRQFDANCDGLVNNFDINPFVIGIVDGRQAWEAQFGCDFVCAFDGTGDGLVNNFDIGPFVDAIIGN